MKSLRLSIFLLAAVISVLPSRTHAQETAASVKSYLLEKLKKITKASQELVANSEAYAAKVAASDGSVEAAYKKNPEDINKLIAKMQENYKAIDSFGYETIEGIVAGVPSMADYDIYLDAGVPASEGPENVALVVLTLASGEKIDKQGALFTYIIEPALWGGDKRWTEPVDGGKKLLPRPEVLTAAAKDANKRLEELWADANAWNASVSDCFGAMVVMTPTLSDYFEDWKESRYAKDKSGRFQAVSRVSDMRGIMGSCQVMYEAVEKQVAEKDKSLAKSVDSGFKGIMTFLDKIEKREKQGEIKGAEIDELATQAKEKTDKLVPQIEQSAAVVGVKVET
ncbi:MAG TPA: imelysin family protein [Terrimicrobiaceae bacterium]